MSGPRAVQLALDLGHRPALGREDFLVADNNADAVAWIDRWPDWPGPALCLVGPAGSGKTHLAQVWRARSGAEVIEGGVLTSGSPLTSGRIPKAVVVEGADCPGDEEALLHLYNMIAEDTGHLLLTATAPPSRWDLRLSDLVSRLRAAPVTRIDPPGDALLAAVLVKQFADRQLRVGADIVAYLVARMERSFAAATEIVAALDAAALARRRDITIALAREVLRPENEEGTKR